MPCDSKPLTQTQREAQVDALKRLEAALGSKVSVVVGAQGAVAFKGWAEADRAGLADVCAYRRLLAGNSAALRRAVARAEAMAGRSVDARAVGSGIHSHDGGGSWSAGHAPIVGDPAVIWRGKP